MLYPAGDPLPFAEPKAGSDPSNPTLSPRPASGIPGYPPKMTVLSRKQGPISEEQHQFPESTSSVGVLPEAVPRQRPTSRAMNRALVEQFGWNGFHTGFDDSR